MNPNCASNPVHSRGIGPRALLASVPLLLAASVALAACTDAREVGAETTESTSAQTAAGFPRTVTTPTGEQVVIPTEPQRVIPANANALDFVLALIEPERVAAISEVSLPYSLAGKALGEWPEEKTFGQFTVEEIVSRKPDLVVVHDWQAAQTVAIIREAGIPVLVIPSVVGLEDNFASLTLLGSALGAEAKAAETIAALNLRIASLQERGAKLDASVLSYTNMGTGGTCAGSGTSFDVMTKIAGLSNLAAAEGLVGFESVDNEWLLSIDPDWIVVGESAELAGTSTSQQYLLETPALAGLGAVRSEQIIRLRSDFFFTSSHHLVDAAERLLDELDALRARE